VKCNRYASNRCRCGDNNRARAANGARDGCEGLICGGVAYTAYGTIYNVLSRPRSPHLPDTHPQSPASLARILAHERVGEVAVGEGVTERQIGDRVGMPVMQKSCGRLAVHYVPEVALASTSWLHSGVTRVARPKWSISLKTRLRLR
jgi:hypothetical protein